MDTETKLYVVKENDTLQTISEQNSIPISEIIRLNPLSKYHIFPGQPLILNVEIKEERNEKRINKFSLIEFFYNLKITLMSSIFFKKGFGLYYNNFMDSYNNLQTFPYINKKKLLELFEKLFIFESYLDIDKDKELIEFQKQINEIIFTLKEDIPNNKFLSMDKMIESIELYILNLYSEDFLNAETYYSNFIIEFKNIFIS